MNMPVTRQITCSLCNRESVFNPYILPHILHENTICQGCYERETSLCDSCGALELTNDINCIERTDDEGDNYTEYLCNNCYDDTNGGRIRFSSYATGIHDKFTGGGQGELIKSERIFSVEIECVFPSNKDAVDFSKEIPTGIGIGTDGSVNGYGLEIRTPKLSQANGEKTILNICRLLKKHNAIADNSCGLHVHIDAPDFIADTDGKLEKLKNLLALYVAFEPVILSFLPRQRRTNQFCRTIGSKFSIAEIRQIESVREFEKLWYRIRTTRGVESVKEQGNHGHDTRYNGFNLHCLLALGNLEIRFHSGTTNPKKILEWVKLHVSILDATSIMRGFVPSLAEEAVQEIDIDEKTEMLFRIASLGDESEKYWRGRQEKFASRRGSKNILEDSYIPA